MDTKKLIDALTRNPAAAGALGGLAGSLLGSVLTGGKVKAGGLLKAGGLATIGYLAYQAWQRHQAQKAGLAVTEPERRPAAASAPAALPEAFDLLATSHATQALQVVRAMVAAAKADGVVDAAEQTRIAERVRTAGLSSEEQAQVLKLLTEPLNIDAVVSGVESPELASEIYAASLLAVHPANRAERAYLDMLAARLQLDPGLVAELERGVAAAAAPA